MRFVLVILALLLPLPAHAQTVPERLGPQFLFGWTVPEQETVLKALRKLEYEHEMQPRGFDDYMMARQRRTVAAIEQGYRFWDQNWKPIQPFVFDAVVLRDGNDPAERAAWRMRRSTQRSTPAYWQQLVESNYDWGITAMSMPMTILTGTAVSKGRECRWQDQDMDEFVARWYCADTRARAVAMFETHFAHKRAIVLGGAPTPSYPSGKGW